MLTKSNLIVFAVSTLLVGSVMADERKVTEKSFLKKAHSQDLQSAQDYSPAGCVADSGAASCLNLTGNDNSSHGGASSFDEIVSHAPNVLVTMYVKSAFNQPVSYGGFNPEGNAPANSDINNNVWFKWQTSSLEADLEAKYSLPWVPIPGVELDYSEFLDYPSYGGMIYQALIYGACGALNSFDIVHSSYIKSKTGAPHPLGFFEATDTETINGTGYYNMNYSMVATEEEDGDQIADQFGREDNAGISIIHVKGTVSVTCTALNSLD